MIVRNSGFSLQEKIQVTINLSSLFGEEVASWMMSGLTVPAEKVQMAQDLKYGLRVDLTKN